MRKKLIITLVVTMLLGVSIFSFVQFTQANTQDGRPFDIKPVYDSKYTDILTLEGAEFKPPNSPWLYPTINDYTGALEWLYFENIFNGTYGNIWVALDPTYDWYVDNGEPGYSPDDVWYFSYPWTDDGIEDPNYPGGYYLQPGYIDYITGADLLEVLSEFDNNIHDTDTGYFGMYNNNATERPGPYGDGSVQIMVFNIKDELFYDPVNAAGFIEGYFWSSIAEWGANAFHMDTYQWWRRQGENPPMVGPYGYDYSYLSVKAWEYEGTFAHEFQHLIHYDRDPDEFSWVDEGCATLAEWLCGYGFSPGHISEYLLWFWDTPLTIWEGYLADYGASFLWTYYMYEHYGGAELLTNLVEDQANGIEGWENALAAMGIRRSFDTIFQDWCIANYLDDTSFGKGRYGYYELDIPSENSEFLDIPTVMQIWYDQYPGSGFFEWYVNEYPYAGEYILVGRGLPYTASYVEFTDAPLFLEIEFDGDDYCGAAPSSGEYNWFSDGTAWSYYKLGHNFDLTAVTEPTLTLTFTNYFSIEADWDYGYVEVHNLDTDEWTTLPGLLTTTDLAYQQDNPYCPDNLEPTTYAAAGEWNAFTGDSYGMYQEEMDLTPFIGSNIDLFFTYWTDGYTQASGWYIDDITIPEIDYLSDVETEDPSWTVNGGWYRNNEIILNDFKVSFIQSSTIYDREDNPSVTFNFINRMWINEDTEIGDEHMIVLNTEHIQTTIVMVVANQPGYEHTFGAYYTFTAESMF